MSDDKAVFVGVDVSTLPANVKAKWDALQKANLKAREAKQEFETLFISSAKKMERIDQDVELAFVYKFGKLAIAKVDKASKPKSSKPKFTF